MVVSKDPFSFISKLPEEKKDVYNILRYAIVGLYLQPGLIVSIQDICEKFGMGRSPVRDALLRLEKDGLVELLPQRGVQISLIDPARMEQERFLRFSVEKEIMIRFMGQHSASDILSLQHMLMMQKEMLALGSVEPRKFLQMDDEFHQFFYKVVKMNFCLQTISNVTGDYQRVRLLSVLNGREDANVVQQHEDLVTAILLNDAGKMEEKFLQHVGKIDIELDSLKKQYASLFVKSALKEKDNPLEESDFLSKLA